LLFGTHQIVKSPTFSLKKFIEKQGRPPILDLATYPTYDAVYAIANALKVNGDLQLVAMEQFEGVTGQIKFADDGSMRAPETAHVLKDGKVERLD